MNNCESNNSLSITQEDYERWEVFYIISKKILVLNKEDNEIIIIDDSEILNVELDLQNQR